MALHELRGRVVVLSFWMTDCPPCNVEAPHLQRLHRNYFQQGLRVVGVAPLRGPVTELHSFVRRHEITYPTLVDPGEKVGKQYGLQTYPLTVLVDSKGKVQWIHRGFQSGDEAALERQIRTALKGS